jgi:hypothetical protein
MQRPGLMIAPNYCCRPVLAYAGQQQHEQEKQIGSHNAVRLLRHGVQSASDSGL